MNQMLKPSETIANKAVLVHHSPHNSTITIRAKTQAGQSYPFASVYINVPACISSHLSTECVQMRPAGVNGRPQGTTIKTKLGTYDICPVNQMICNGSQPYQGTSIHFRTTSFVLSDDSAGLFLRLFIPCADYNYAR